MDQSSRPSNAHAKSGPVAAQPQTRTAPAPAQTKSAPPSRAATPHVEPSAVQGPPPENLTIAPVPSPNNDRSIDFDWESAILGSNRSLGCTVTSADDHELTVTIEQSTYQRSMRGSGVIKIIAVPVAPIGTQGTLTARDTMTGATAVFSWQWHPRSAGEKAVSAKAKGFLSRLFSGRARTAAAPAKSQAKVAASVAERLGARAASATTLQFFGQEAVGHRFAFILDISGSMRGARWDTCTRELEGALRAMPENVEFFIILFSSHEHEPPGQTGWMSAERSRVEGVVSWIGNIRPSGGTYPAGAFKRVFSLPEPADVIYFLTDGELEGFTPSDCTKLRGSTSTIVNTIALDNQASADLLDTIASESGGQYIHVSATSPR